MKYKLKKDLPFAKAGTEVRYFYGTSVEHINYNREINAVDIHIPMKDVIQSYFDEGWIEEVKPREWRVIIGKYGEAKGIYLNELIAGDEVSSSDTTIKVREVIE